jgi:hypothetical protein
MPIEFGFKPHDESHEIDTHIVEPGDGVFMSDYSEGLERIISITCERDDTKGLLMIYNSEDMVTIERNGQLSLTKLPHPLARIAILQSMSHEQEFTDENNYLGTLSIRYVPGDKITKSFNEPRGLAYPN